MDFERLSPFAEMMSALVYLTTNAERSVNRMKGYETVILSALKGGGCQRLWYF